MNGPGRRDGGQRSQMTSGGAEGGGVQGALSGVPEGDGRENFFQLFLVWFRIFGLIYYSVSVLERNNILRALSACNVISAYSHVMCFFAYFQAANATRSAALKVKQETCKKQAQQ